MSAVGRSIAGKANGMTEILVGIGLGLVGGVFWRGFHNAEKAQWAKWYSEEEQRLATEKRPRTAMTKQYRKFLAAVQAEQAEE
mmetsp:Transcript_18567/g.26047  ORF Transcript_18567/g.26047 Transcript_18567/m.26047 type:complete len:83 (-) Transcript_18567:316-564(-)